MKTSSPTRVYIGLRNLLMARGLSERQAVQQIHAEHPDLVRAMRADGVRQHPAAPVAHQEPQDAPRRRRMPAIDMSLMAELQAVEARYWAEERRTKAQPPGRIIVRLVPPTQS